MRIYNYSGQEFDLPASSFNGKIQIDIGSIPNGVYVLYLASDDGIYQSTFIKQID
jgi:hypothetical protein